ncbi:Glycosyltransferase involved in cell wall bisynthesis [Klenkia marina]|uniref:Glycosyltransferase involved in cell wall bisynthesis n=1 Tax=Klenkia marina TaxID=1960309 RepID=A0A1G4YE63_9ACTN|nr:glycosyltransferase family 1 protein [Klenkia marina]SCX51796.1 Glycosyltransferase involved in cell wall bisynthesis [Klenkia marina]
MPVEPSLRVAMTVEQCWQPAPGGSGTYIRELLRAYAELDDLSVTGISAWHRGSPPEDGPLPVPVRRVPLPRALLYRSWQQARLPRTGGADVVHASTWAVPGRRAPLVATVHDLAFRHDPQHFTPNGVAFFERGLAIVRDEAAAVVVPSSATAADCVAAGIEPERVHVVLHGVRAGAADPAGVATFRARHGLVRPYVLWAGTREPRKNLPRLVAGFSAAVRAGADLDLVLVGPDGWGDERDRLAGVSADRVRVLGRLPATDLSAAYAGAHVFCYPSVREGFGMPVSEAMAHGVPVVTSRGTSMEEVSDGAAVLVDPMDEDDIGRGIVEAIWPGAHPALAAASRARAAQLSWSRAAAQTVAVLREAAG